MKTLVILSVLFLTACDSRTEPKYHQNEPNTHQLEVTNVKIGQRTFNVFDLPTGERCITANRRLEVHCWVPAQTVE